MSGGAYDYAHSKVEQAADALRLVGTGDAARPSLRAALRARMRQLAAAMKAVEWNDSGDGDSDEASLIAALMAPMGEPAGQFTTEVVLRAEPIQEEHYSRRRMLVGPSLAMSFTVDEDDHHDIHHGDLVRCLLELGESGEWRLADVLEKV